MNPNTHSMSGSSGLDRLAAAVDELAAQDLARLPDAQAAQRVLVLRGLPDRLEAIWLRELAGWTAAAPPPPTTAPPPSPPPPGSTPAPARAQPTPTNASGSPTRCTTAPCLAPPRPWPPARSPTRTRR